MVNNGILIFMEDTLWWTNKKLLNMAIEIVDFPMKNGGSFHGKMLVHERVMCLLCFPIYVHSYFPIYGCHWFPYLFSHLFPMYFMCSLLFAYCPPFFSIFLFMFTFTSLHIYIYISFFISLFIFPLIPYLCTYLFPNLFPYWCSLLFLYLFRHNLVPYFFPCLFPYLFFHVSFSYCLFISLFIVPIVVPIYVCIYFPIIYLFHYISLFSSLLVSLCIYFSNLPPYSCSYISHLALCPNYFPMFLVGNKTWFLGTMGYLSVPVFRPHHAMIPGECLAENQVPTIQQPTETRSGAWFDLPAITACHTGTNKTKTCIWVK